MWNVLASGINIPRVRLLVKGGASSAAPPRATGRSTDRARACRFAPALRRLSDLSDPSDRSARSDSLCVSCLPPPRRAFGSRGFVPARHLLVDHARPNGLNGPNGPASPVRDHPARVFPRSACGRCFCRSVFSPLDICRRVCYTIPSPRGVKVG